MGDRKRQRSHPVSYTHLGNPKALLDLNEARAQGWTIIDNTPKPKKGERDNRKSVSYTHLDVYKRQVRKLQGFFLNRMPDEDELSYNQTSYGGDRNVMATMYVQLRSDLDEAGQIRADLDGLNVPYDSSRPNADRWARNGYRKVYPKRAGYNPDGWSYYRESDGTYPVSYTHLNNWLTVGYKSLASYTVDFRQLGISSAGVAKNKSGYSLYGNGTVPQDYNAAANVEMVVTLPSDN